MQELLECPSNELVELDEMELTEVNGGGLGDPLQQGVCGEVWDWIRSIIKVEP